MPIGRDRIGDQLRTCCKCKKEYVDPDRKDWNKLPFGQKAALVIEKPLYWFFFLPLGSGFAGAIIIGLTSVVLKMIGMPDNVQRWVIFLALVVVVVLFLKVLLSDMVEFFSELAKARRRRLTE